VIFFHEEFLMLFYSSTYMIYPYILRLDLQRPCKGSFLYAYFCNFPARFV